MKCVPGMLEGALAARFYQSITGPFPIEIGIAVPGASLSVVIIPDARQAAPELLNEEELGLSLLEAEATGLPAGKVCEQLNGFLAGRRVKCTSSAEIEAVACLFQACGLEMEFHLSTLASQSPHLSRLWVDSHYPETIARDLFVLVRPS